MIFLPWFINLTERYHGPWTANFHSKSENKCKDLSVGGVLIEIIAFSRVSQLLHLTFVPIALCIQPIPNPFFVYKYCLKKRILIELSMHANITNLNIRLLQHFATHCLYKVETVEFILPKENSSQNLESYSKRYSIR